MELYDPRIRSHHRVKRKVLAFLAISTITIIVWSATVMERSRASRQMKKVDSVHKEVDIKPKISLLEKSTDQNASHITKLPRSRSSHAVPYFQPHLWPLDADLSTVVHKVLSGQPAGISPINIHPYMYTTASSRNCSITANLYPRIIILVKSAVPHTKHRQLIRKTWGNANYTASLGAKVFFLLGTNFDNSSHILIQNEFDKNGDIIQESFNDTYYNNTLKTTMAFNWLVDFCQTVKYIMFVDDDYFVATDKIVLFLKNLDDMGDVYIGKKNSYLKPHRFPNSRWYISREQYPFRDYPLFLDAGAYVMTMNVAKKFQIGMQYTKSYIFDDVFLAIVASKVGIKPVHSDLFQTAQTYDKGLAIHMNSHERLGFTWKLYAQLKKTS